MDHAGTGLAFWCSHGSCNDIAPTATALACLPGLIDCPTGSYCPGGTVPSDSTHTYYHSCIAQIARQFDVSGSASPHSNVVSYGTTAAAWSGTGVDVPNIGVAQGEDVQSGNFEGAGTNGGANVTVFWNSCGFRSQYWLDETSTFFAGVHAALGFVNVQNLVQLTSGVVTNGLFGDTLDDGSWGAGLADTITAHETSPLGVAFWYASTTPGNEFVTHWYSGGATYPSGTHPDGATYVMASDSSSCAASWHVGGNTTGCTGYTSAENWYNSIFDAYDATGQQWWAASWTCNYDCNTLGL